MIVNQRIDVSIQVIDRKVLISYVQEGELKFGSFDNQCKSSLARAVGWDAIKKLTTGAALYQVRFPDTRFRRCAVTNQSFISGAKAHALVNNVPLVERHRIEEELGEHSVHNHELKDELSAINLLQTA